MVVMRELEPVPQEPGTTTRALHTQHPPNPDCACRLTVPLYNLPGGCHRFCGINNTGTRHWLSFQKDNTMSGSQKWTAMPKRGGGNTDGGGGLGS